MAQKGSLLIVLIAIVMAASIPRGVLALIHLFIAAKGQSKSFPK